MVSDTMTTKYGSALVCVIISGCATHSAAIRNTGPELARLLNNKAATVLIETDVGGHGTGVILNHDGYILTSEHVIRNAKIITVFAHPNVSSTRTSLAKLIASRKPDDLAIIKTELPMPAVVSLGELRRLHQGDTVYTESHPYRYGSLVSKGYLMSKRQKVTAGPDGRDNVLLADIVEEPGSLGCGLFSARDGAYIGMLFLDPKMADTVNTPLAIKVFHSVETVRAFLDEIDIVYHIEYQPEPKWLDHQRLDPRHDY